MTTLAARPEAITFAPHQSALIVVDMQNAYASQGGYLDLAGFDVSATRPVIENIKTAVNAARAAGMLIVWFQNGWDDQYVEAGGPGSPNFHKSNALKTMRKRPELQGTLLASLPTSAWNPPCATASSWNILAWCWKTPPIRPGRRLRSKRPCSTSKPFLAGSATSRIFATP